MLSPNSTVMQARYVITPAPHCDSTVYITPGQFGGCLGAKYDPLVLHADPNAANFQAPNIGLRGDLNRPSISGPRQCEDAAENRQSRRC
jgi:hypothetical protein